MSIADSVNQETKDKLFKLTLSKGAIFINKFDEIDHPKFFIVVGLSQDKAFTCSVYINSTIHPSIKRKQNLLDLQIEIKASKYKFLDYDSYVCCSTPLPIDATNIKKWIDSNSCYYKGSLDQTDLGIITNKLINSDLFSEEEIDLYFK